MVYIKYKIIYIGVNSSVESSMIYGSQYDAMINWVKNGKNEDSKAKISSNSYGNISSKKNSVTGADDYSNDCINNIMDLGGNLSEWTLEANDSTRRVMRGGNFSSAYSPSCRTDGCPDFKGEFAGSRLALYISL